MNRRGFFTGLVKAAAIVALAPQLAFRKPTEVFTVTFRANYVGIYEQLRMCEHLREPIMPLDLKEFLQLNYEIKKRRGAEKEFIEMYLVADPETELRIQESFGEGPPDINLYEGHW